MLVRAPLSLETAKEVRTKDDDISAEVMADVLRAIVSRAKSVDRSHDIPYLAGYSQSGETIYIDRHMPKSFVVDGRRIETDRFLVLHEVVEKALLDELGLNYLHAHQIALRTERAAVEALGVPWKSYDGHTKENEKQIGDERLKNVPNDLDLTPYRDEKDFSTLQRIISAIHPREEK
jgi:hypothetical protein